MFSGVDIPVQLHPKVALFQLRAKLREAVLHQLFFFF